MKNLITLFLLFATFTCEAQYVTEANGKKGLKDAQGNILLPFEYDSIIPFIQFDRPTDFYIIRSGYKYGVFHTGSHQSTGCIYDRVFPEYNILYLRSQDKLGFVSTNTNGEWKIIEPQFHQLHPIRTYAFGGTDPIHSIQPEGNPLTVRIDNHWGIIAYTDGHYRIPCQYMNEIITFEHDDLWFSIDHEHKKQIVFNPKTGVEFHAPAMCTKEFNEDSSLLIITSQYRNNVDHDTLYSQVFDFATGERIWHHESTATWMKVNVYGSDIVSVSELYNDPKMKLKNDLQVFTFYNLKSASPIFRYEGTGEEVLKVKALDDRLEVTFVEFWKEKAHYEKTILR